MRLHLRPNSVGTLCRQILALLLFSLSLNACVDDQHQNAVETYIMQTKKKTPPAIPPLPEIKPYVAPEYDTTKSRSPFQQSAATQEDTKRFKEPLENFPLDSLRLVGIITLAGKPWGLINAPDGKLYRVTVGQYLGQNSGKLVKIQPSYLEIEETIIEGKVQRLNHVDLVLWSQAQQAKTP